MADKYILKEGTKMPTVSADDGDKAKQIARTWTEEKEEVFTINDLENQIAQIDKTIEDANVRKAELQAKITEAEKVIAE